MKRVYKIKFANLLNFPAAIQWWNIVGCSFFYLTDCTCITLYVTIPCTRMNSCSALADEANSRQNHWGAVSPKTFRISSSEWDLGLQFLPEVPPALDWKSCWRSSTFEIVNSSRKPRTPPTPKRLRWDFCNHVSNKDIFSCFYFVAIKVKHWSDGLCRNRKYLRMGKGIVNYRYISDDVVK